MSEIVTDASEEVLATYTLCLIGPPPTPENGGWPGAALNLLASGVLEAEENLTDLLPRGYRVQIREWSDPQ